MLKLDNIEWSRRLFMSLNENGKWAIPKCGMIFERRRETLVLVCLMPHDPDMPISAERLLFEQRAMYEECKRHFEAAGIAVSVHGNLLKESSDGKHQVSTKAEQED